MSREIRFSKRAANRFDNILEFLEAKWSLKVKNNFILKIDRSLSKIQMHPDCFPESEKFRGLRKCVVTKQTTLFYKYTDSSIDIVAIFDNRQNPVTLTKGS